LCRGTGRRGRADDTDKRAQYRRSVADLAVCVRVLKEAA
jgi:hypothetical protein